MTPVKVTLWCVTLLLKGVIHDSLTSNTALTQRIFYRVWATYGPQRVGPGKNAASVGVCAVRTSVNYPQARSFMYNYFTTMCVPGGYLEKEQPPPDFGEGVLHVALKPPARLAVMSKDNHTACVGFFKEEMTFQQAKKFCKDLGYFLVSVTSLNKLNLLTSLAGDKTFWVGCEDITIEGQFVWVGDDTRMTTDNMAAVFLFDAPNNHSNQDCCVYRYETNKLDDFSCQELRPFVCEVSLVDCIVSG